MKIPNFFHLTPQHVKKHCAAIKRKWFRALQETLQISRSFCQTANFVCNRHKWDKHVVSSLLVSADFPRNKWVEFSIPIRRNNNSDTECSTILLCYLIKIWVSGGKFGSHVVCIWSFNHEHIKVIWRAFGGLFRKLARNSKMAHCRAKRMNIWASEICVVGLWVLFDLGPVRVVRHTFPSHIHHCAWCDMCTLNI